MLLIDLSSCSTVPALRFRAVLNGGLSSGVNGVFEPREGLGERFLDLNDIEEVRLTGFGAFSEVSCEVPL